MPADLSSGSGHRALTWETIISVTDASDRPYQAGYLVWLQVEVGTAAAATWFRGIMLTPDYRMQRQGRSLVQFSALDLSDALNEEITVSNQSNGTIAANFGLLLDGVGWPDDADWRDIDADLIEQLSSWEHSSGRAITSAQALTDTVGPPARMVIRRNGGMRVIKDVADMPEASFADADVRELPDLQQHEDSVINTVTIEGTTLGSLSSTVRNTRPLEYMVLDGLAATERVNVIRRILRAYENGLTTLALDFHADDDRNQADVALLEPGRVIELDSTFLGGTFEGPVSGLRWRWEGTRAFVRANVVVQPPLPEVFGLRLYITGLDEDFLYLIDPETGLATQIDVGDPTAMQRQIRGLAYDPNANILWGTNDQQLVKINTTTGVGTIVSTETFVASLGWFQFTMEALAFDHVNDRLVGVGEGRFSSGDSQDRRAVVIDTADGSATLLGAQLAASEVSGLAFNPATGDFWLSYVQSGTKLAVMSGTDASLSNILSTQRTYYGLAYDFNNLVLYGIGPAANAEWVFSIDPITAQDMQIGTTANFGLSSLLRARGLAYMRLPDPP